MEGNKKMIKIFEALDKARYIIGEEGLEFNILTHKKTGEEKVAIRDVETNEMYSLERSLEFMIKAEDKIEDVLEGMDAARN